MRAFTLLESLVYIALFGLLLSGILTGVTELSMSAERNQTKSFLDAEGNFLMAKIIYEETHARSISVPLVNSAPSNELSLISSTGSPIQIYINHGSLVHAENSISLPLSSNSVTVTGLSFLFTENGLQTNLQISATSGGGQAFAEAFSNLTYLFP